MVSLVTQQFLSLVQRFLNALSRLLTKPNQIRGNTLAWLNGSSFPAWFFVFAPNFSKTI